MLTDQMKSYLSETTSSEAQLDSRSTLASLFANSPLPPDDLLFNLGLYTRSSLLVKFLVMNQLYERIKNIPGQIFEFGVWYGQNLVLMENLRAIHEPFNKQRKIIGFDTFTGYENLSTLDKQSDAFADQSYSTSKDYKGYLDHLLKAHEGMNVLGHIQGNHELIEGDICETVPGYFKQHPETIVALAYFDLGTYNPTLAAMQAILPHLVPGSVILLDQLTWPDAPGEAVAFKEVFGSVHYKIEKIALYPSKSLLVIQD